MPQNQDDRIERATASQQRAISSLLSEVAGLSERQRRRLDTVGFVDVRIDELREATEALDGAVVETARAQLDAEMATVDRHVCCAQIAEDEKWGWYSFPEADNLAVDKGFLYIMRSLPSGTGLIIRMIPVEYIGDVRNVPRDHPFLDTCVEWTTDGQGQPFWDAESEEIALAEGAFTPGIDPAVRESVRPPGSPRSYEDRLAAFSKLSDEYIDKHLGSTESSR